MLLNCGYFTMERRSHIERRTFEVRAGLLGNSNGPNVAPVIVILAFFIPSPDALLLHGGVGGANTAERRLWRSLVVAPVPRGTDTAGPAGRS